jgi:hypothetical protein
MQVVLSTCLMPVHTHACLESDLCSSACILRQLLKGCHTTQECLLIEISAGQACKRRKWSSSKLLTKADKSGHDQMQEVAGMLVMSRAHTACRTNGESTKTVLGPSSSPLPLGRHAPGSHRARCRPGNCKCLHRDYVSCWILSFCRGMWAMGPQQRIEDTYAPHLRSRFSAGMSILFLGFIQ